MRGQVVRRLRRVQVARHLPHQRWHQRLLTIRPPLTDPPSCMVRWCSTDEGRDRPAPATSALTSAVSHRSSRTDWSPLMHGQVGGAPGDLASWQSWHSIEWMLAYSQFPYERLSRWKHAFSSSTKQFRVGIQGLNFKSNPPSEVDKDFAQVPILPAYKGEHGVCHHCPVSILSLTQTLPRTLDFKSQTWRVSAPGRTIWWGSRRWALWLGCSHQCKPARSARLSDSHITQSHPFQPLGADRAFKSDRQSQRPASHPHMHRETGRH